MKLKLMQMSLGPLGTNAVVIVDEDNREAIVVDPSFESEVLAEWSKKEDLEITQIWITHGHADHTAGVPALLRALPNEVEIFMSEEAYAMVQKQGADFFGMALEPFPEVTRFISHGAKLGFVAEGGELKAIAEARFAPGHAPGSVVYFLPEAKAAIVGDVIFREGIGRWDFEGGNFAVLTRSIREQIFTLPDDTVLIPGHGPVTTVAWEKAHNPYLA